MQSGQIRPGGSWTPREDSGATATRAYFRQMGNHWKRYHFARKFVAGKRVLDFGCGHGLGVEAMAPAARSVLGVDADLDAIGWARMNIPREGDRVGFQTLEEFERETPPVQFDVITCFEVIEHVPDPRTLLRDLRRHLAEDGLAILSTPNGTSSLGRPALFRSEYHMAEFLPTEFERLLLEAGFDNGRFYRERRVDCIDVAWLWFRRASALRSGRGASAGPATSAASTPLDRLGPPLLRPLISGAFHRAVEHVNGPAYWQIRRTRRLTDLLDHSTTIAVMTNGRTPVARP